MHTLISLAVCATLLFFAPTDALAGASDTSDVACGSSSSGWNAPKGALVLSRTNGGVIEPVITAISEYRTHSVMSHGAGYWVTHSTMHSPGSTGWPTYCSTPANPTELAEGYPGLSQTNQGGMYTFFYGGDHGPVHLKYQMPGGDNGDIARDVADWLWYDSDYQYVSSKQGSSGLYRIGISDSNGSWFDQPYVLYQYRNSQNRHHGWQWTPMHNGTVCSTAIAWALHKSSGGAHRIDTGAYDHNTIVNAGNQLYNAVKSSCSDGLGFWGGVGTAVTCFESICDDAGRQVRNCMATGVCDSDSSSHWNNMVNDSSATAVSNSPDNIGGWARVGNSQGPWASTGETQISWNSGGNVYGCFF